MEGERIMKCVLRGTLNKDLPLEIKGYLRPLLAGKTTKDVSSKYQPYSLKLLKAIIQKLSSTQEPSPLLLDAAQICIDSLETSDRHCPLQIKGYTFEKLLLNFVSLASKLSLIDTVMSCYRITYDRLSALVIDADTQPLINSLADILWNAAGIIINKQSQQQEDDSLDLDTILSLQRNSLTVLLLLSDQFQKVLKRAMCADAHLIKRCGSTAHTWSKLVSFHESLLADKTFEKNILKCQDCPLFLSVFEWLLLLNKSHIRLGDTSRIKSFFDRIQKLTQNHYKKCTNKCRHIYDLLITLHQCIPSLPSTRQLSSLLSLIDQSSLTSSHLLLLTDNIEFTIIQTKDSICMSNITNAISSITTHKREIISNIFHPLKNLFLFYDKCLESYMKNDSISSNVTLSIKYRQLKGVNLLIETLVKLLLDALQTDKNLQCEGEISQCVPLIKRSGVVLDSITSVPIIEHRSLGVNAYNIGQILCQMNSLIEAGPLLQLACQQFYIYCQKSNNDTWQEMSELKLYKKFTQLIETLLKAGKTDVAMETLELMMSSLNETVSEDQLVSCMDQFACIKCIGRTLLDPSHILLTRNSCDWLPSCHSNDSLKLLCLQEELKSYQSLSQDTRAWQFSVAKQLVTLYPKRSHKHCWILIKLASLSVSTSFSTCNELLCQAIFVLKSSRDKKYMTATYDLLGLAHFWKGLCSHVLERETANCEDRVIESLTVAVDYWCKMDTKNLNDDSFVDYSSTLHHLLLCASLTNTLHLSHLSLKVLDLLLTLSQSDDDCDSSLLFYQALAMKTKLLLSVCGVESVTGEVRSQLELAAKPEAVDSIEKGEEKMYMCRLMCKLQLSHLYILNGEVNRGYELLKSVLTHSIMEGCNIQSLLAPCTIITSLYLQCLWKPSASTSSVKDMLNYFTIKGPCNVKLCPCNELINESDTRKTNKSFFLTNLELSMDNLKLIRKLMQGLISTSFNESASSLLLRGDEGEELVAMGTVPVYKTWEITSLLLESILSVSQDYLSLGMMQESEHYGEEGMKLAMKLHLALWHVKFLIHMAKIKMTMTDYPTASDHLLQASVLLGLETTPTTDTPTNDSDLAISIERLSLGSNGTLTVSPTRSILRLAHSVTYCQYWLENRENMKCLTNISDIMVALEERGINELTLPYLIECIQLKVRAFIATNKLTEIQPIIAGNDKLLSIATHKWSHLPSIRLELAKLYYYISIGTLLQIEDSPLIEKLSNGVSGKKGMTPSSTTRTTTAKVSTRNKRSTRRRRAMRISDDEEEEEEEENKMLIELQPTLSYLLKASQNITPPTLSTCLYRDVYQLLGFCLSGVCSDFACHCLLHSCSVSINQQSVYWFGKKIRKESGVLRSSKTILNEILSMLSQSDCSYSSPLVQARLKLHPLPHPPTLSYTQGLIDNLPDEWVYCTLSMIEVFRNKRILMLLRVQSKKDNILVNIPFNEQIKSSSVNCSRGGQTECELLSRFKGLLTASKGTTEITDTREWWTKRWELNKQLEDILLKIESSWLGYWKILLLSTLPSLSSTSFSTLSSLLTKCGISTVWVGLLVGGARLITSRELQAILQSLIRDTTCGVTVAEITRAIRNAKSSPSPPQPLIISLASSLQCVPLENIPLLCDQLVTRIPSLQFLTARLLLQDSTSRRRTGLNPTHTYYVVNPSGDLINTERAFGEWFESEEGWNGVIGRRPSIDEFVNGLQTRDTFIYLGHGRAREYLGRDQRVQELDTHATILQMGCSSGRLETIGSLDPQGMALNFLISGCPFLVANLWDVTDVDIDRFCTSLLKNWLIGPSSDHQGEKTRTHIELLCNLTEARDSCRLRYLIGASPVVYGLPAH